MMEILQEGGMFSALKLTDLHAENTLVSILRQATVKATQLKEEAYVVCFNGDYFFPFAL